MTPSQVRRLEAVAAAICPCLGCLQEDLVEAERELQQRSPESVAMWRDVNDRARLGLEPDERASAVELEEQRAYAKSARDHAQHAVQVVLMAVPTGKRRAKCSACAYRKRSREQISALAKRLSHRLQEDRDLQAEDQDEIS